MNLHRLRKGEWIAAISGAVLIVSLFLPWWEGADGGRLSGWEALTALDVALALLGLSALAVWAITAVARNTAPGVASGSSSVSSSRCATSG